MPQWVLLYMRLLGVWNDDQNSSNQSLTIIEQEEVRGTEGGKKKKKPKLKTKPKTCGEDQVGKPLRGVAAGFRSAFLPVWSFGHCCAVLA